MNNNRTDSQYTNSDISHWFNDPYNIPEDHSLTEEQLQLQQIRESALSRYRIHDEELKQFDFSVKQIVDKLLINLFDIHTPSSYGLIRDRRWAVRVLYLLKKVIDSCNGEQVAGIHLEELLADKFDDADTFATLSCGHVRGIMPALVNGTANLLKMNQPKNISDLANIIASSCLMPPKYFGEIYHRPLIYREQVENTLKQCMGSDCKHVDQVMNYFTAHCFVPIEPYKDIFESCSLQNGLDMERIRDTWWEITRCLRPAPDAASTLSVAVLFYIVSYLKTHCPKAFYTTVTNCEWSESLPEILIEMQEFTGIQIQNPDINHSYDVAYVNTENRLVWPLNFIRTIGPQSADCIVSERCVNGNFTSLSNFIQRIMFHKNNRGAMTTGRLVSLILAGCFDKIEKVPTARQRHKLIERLSEEYQLKVPNSELYRRKNYHPMFWKMQQKTISGIDRLDYQHLFEQYRKRYPIKRRGKYWSFEQIAKSTDCQETVLICATVFDCAVEPVNPMYDSLRRYYAKLKLRQNNHVVELLIWDKEAYNSKVGDLRKIKGKVVVISAKIAHSEYLGINYLEWQEFSTLRQVESMLYGERGKVSKDK